jgi:hypothetical protein
MGRYGLPQFNTGQQKAGKYGLPGFGNEQNASGLSFDLPSQSANSTIPIAPDPSASPIKTVARKVKDTVEGVVEKLTPVQIAARMQVGESFTEAAKNAPGFGGGKQAQIERRIELSQKFQSEGLSKEEASQKAAQLAGVERIVGDTAGIVDAVPIPPKTRLVGNIRLDKFDLPKDSLDDFAKIIEDNDAFVTQRRGVQTFADTEALAHEVKVPTKVKPGKAFNAEELQALGNQIAYTRTQLDEVATKIKLGDNTDLSLLKQAELQTKIGALFASYSGATAEAGRSLSILRNVRKAVASKDPDLIKQAVNALGGRDKIEEVANRLATFAEDDLLGKYRYIRSLQKPGALDWANWYWYTNLLSGPKTQVRNILGNVSNTTFNFISKPFTSGIEYAHYLATGDVPNVRFGEIPAEAHGILSGIKEGWKKAHFIMKNGFTLDDVAQLDFKPPEVAGGIYTNLIGRSLEAADQFFRSVAASAELHAQAYTSGINEGLKGKAFQEFYEEFVTNPPVEAMKSISRQGARAVFREPGGKIISALTSLKNDFDLKLPSGKTVKVFNPLKFVTPFVSTPANIIKSSLEVTPIGFFTGFFRETAREQSLALGKAAFGSVALLPLALMAAEGRISGSGPKDKELRDLLYSTGWQPNSIRIGNKWYSYSNFQPLALPLSVMANAFELHHYEGGDVDPTAVIAKTANSLFQQSYLSGLAALQDALENPESFGKSFANKFLTSVVPLSGFRGQLTRAEDEVVRSPSTLSESVKSTIPGLSDEVRPRLNAFGEESTRDTGLPQPLEFLSNFLSPIDIRQVKDTPISQELFRLRDSIQIGLPSKSFTVNNAKIELTSDEQNELIKVSGQRIKERLEQAIESESWATRSDEAKAKFIKKLIEDSREQAKKALIRQSDRIKDQIKQSRQTAR